MQLRRFGLTAAVAATSLALAAGPAFARGGGGTGGGTGGGGATTQTPAPAPTAEAWALCPEYSQGSVILADGSTLFANQITGVACVIVKDTPSGSLLLNEIRLAPGWVSTTKSSGGGTSNRVDVEFNNPTTGEKHSILMEPGKTAIR
jgi:hypothetical protein